MRDEQPKVCDFCGSGIGRNGGSVEIQTEAQGANYGICSSCAPKIAADLDQRAKRFGRSR